MNHANTTSIKWHIDQMQQLKNYIGAYPDDVTAKEQYNQLAGELRQAIISNVTVVDLLEIAEYIVSETENTQKQG